MLSMPASPPAEQSAPATPSGPAPTSLRENAPGDGEAGAATTADPSEHCVIVAGGVTTAMLAPLTLRSTSAPEDLQALEQQMLDLRDRVPADLHEDFTTLAHSIGAPPGGPGTFDEDAFRHAVSPVQDWLEAHCAHK